VVTGYQRSLVGSNAWATCGQIREQRLGSGGRASLGTRQRLAVVAARGWPWELGAILARARWPRGLPAMSGRDPGNDGRSRGIPGLAAPGRKSRMMPLARVALGAFLPLRW